MYERQDGWGEETDGWQDKIVGFQSGLHSGDGMSTDRYRKGGWDGWLGSQLEV